MVVTFTNAAAAEMRERILEEITKKLEENPNDVNLQKQIILLNKANISTIHSFCLDVIRNYFYEIDISPNFRVADSPEIEMLKQETLEETFEELYENNDDDFINLIDTYVGHKSDDILKEMILQIYKYIQSTPFPEEWLNEKIENFNDLKSDFSKSIWGKIIIKNFKEEVLEYINSFKLISEKLKKDSDLEKYFLTIMNDIELLENLLKQEYSWDELYEITQNLKFTTWPTDKKMVSDLKEKSKEARNKVKKSFQDLTKTFFIYNSKQANEDINSMYGILKKLEKIIILFSKKYAEAKIEKNIVDFSDIEHNALKILVKKDEQGKHIPTDIAKIYQEKFAEIAIDEYQDSNLVQEYILTTVSKGNNIFMVGDVKQSIYKFRQARPELFLEKYDKYLSTEDDLSDCKNDTKIQLFQNFRSRKTILDFTNMIFKDIMSKDFGDIEYTKEEYLNLGADYLKADEKNFENEKIELNILDLKAEDEVEYEENENQEEIEIDGETDEGIDYEQIQNSELEAKFVANRIKELIDSKYNVYDKKQGYRKATFKDIVILLRTTKEISSIYEKEISDLNLPVFSDISSNYLESTEIQIILSVLKIIDNPNSDIPLITVLRSSIGEFTDNDLIEIRLEEKNKSFYEAICNAKNTKNIELKNKIEKFLLNLEDWQSKQEYLSLDELIWYIYENTGFYSYVSLMPNGAIKTANLKMLFERAKEYEKASFKGLYNFLNFIDKINKNNSDTGSAKLIGENENVIRIMSIHKSKGLEFPITFLCGTGKNFNMKDLTQNILLHQDIGLRA